MLTMYMYPYDSGGVDRVFSTINRISLEISLCNIGN